jgi:hypothetical protein
VSPIEAFAAVLLVIGSSLVLYTLFAGEEPAETDVAVESLPERRAA